MPWRKCFATESLPSRICICLRMRLPKQCWKRASRPIFPEALSPLIPQWISKRTVALPSFYHWPTNIGMPTMGALRWISRFTPNTPTYRAFAATWPNMPRPTDTAFSFIFPKPKRSIWNASDATEKHRRSFLLLTGSWMFPLRRRIAFGRVREILPCLPKRG